MECHRCEKVPGLGHRLFERWGFRLAPDGEVASALCPDCLYDAEESGDFPEPPNRFRAYSELEAWQKRFRIEMVPNERILGKAKERLFEDLAPTEADFWKLYRERLVDPEESYHASRMKQRIIEASESPVSNAHRQVH